MANGPQIVNL